MKSNQVLTNFLVHDAAYTPDYLREIANQMELCSIDRVEMVVDCDYLGGSRIKCIGTIKEDNES